MRRFFESYSTFEASPTLFIDDLFVLPEFRGRHVAYELFLHCLRSQTARLRPHGLARTGRKSGGVWFSMII